MRRLDRASAPKSGFVPSDYVNGFSPFYQTPLQNHGFEAEATRRGGPLPGLLSLPNQDRAGFALAKEEELLYRFIRTDAFNGKNRRQQAVHGFVQGMSLAGWHGHFRGFAEREPIPGWPREIGCPTWI